MPDWTIVMGAGASGRAAARWLAGQGGAVILNDAGPAPGDADALATQGIQGVWGGHPLSILEGCERVILSPGIPRTAPLVAEALARGIEVIGEGELAHRVLRARGDGSKILAVTGTNGKSTTTDLLAHLLRAAEIPTIACGNLGVPFIEAVAQAGPGTVFALELSSYQLESLDTFHAEGAAFLNLTPDHLARYGDLETYRKAKLRIFEGQGPRDLRVLPAAHPGLAKGAPGQGTTARFGWTECEAWCDAEGMLRLHGEPFLHRGELKIPGDHNVENALAAALLASHGGAPLDAIREGLRTYPGLAHRIAFCGEKGGVRCFNDSKGTNVDATLIALRALPGPLVLLLGGTDKGASYEPLREALEGKLRRLIFLGDAIPQLERDLGDLPHETIWGFDDAVNGAFELAEPGDQILLSPACASFDQFKNFEERGRRFEALVEDWTKA
ncbi:MAG TPA: UDP-N-acetylmuramoyl-L-alanine--D-glutamate ligase [Holophagaceae bacterium]|nr:UDP-N-acetylmuramoyl-L-alanine--D-glutamate ligase [Holophagaceae bacterium]